MNKNTQRRAVENYLLGLRATELFTQALDSSFSPLFGPAFLGELRRARVFVLEQSHAQRLLRLAHVSSDEQAEKALWSEPSVPPFEVCFVSFGSGVEVTDYLKSSSGHYVRGLFIASTLFGRDMNVMHFYSVEERCEYEAGELKRSVGLYLHGASRDTFMRGKPAFGPQRVPDRGRLPELFGLGVLHDIAHSPSVTAQKISRELFREEGAVLGSASFVPEVFYAVGSCPERPKRSSGEPAGHGQPRSWRHDVSGHWRMLVKRWDGSEEDESRVRGLRKRGYVVLYPDEPPKKEVAEHLRTRGLAPKTSFEFLAYRLTWIDNHISPKNPSLPYVQGIRTA